ncbi:hypothetical protein F443_07732, partial [Phytophthora nicotianae P1569]
IEILNAIELAKKYNIHRTTLYRWVKPQVKIKAARPTKKFAVDTHRDVVQSMSENAFRTGF